MSLQHIGFDAKRVVCNTSGLGNYSRTLINDLAKRTNPDTFLHLFTPKYGREDLRRQLVSTPQIHYHYPTSQTLLYPTYWRRYGIVKSLTKERIQLFHGLTGELPVGLRKTNIPSVVTVHDLIFLRHPEYYNKADVWFYKHKFHSTLREANRIIAISECTKRDILKFGNYPADKIDVIYQSCHTSFGKPVSKTEKVRIAQKYALPSHYILCVGTIEARKNVGLIVQALSLLPKDVSLVVVGRPTKYTNEIKKQAIELQVMSRILFLHDVPNDELPALYQQAACFAYPSRYEGFGIPIIEAIQGGLPVVASTGSCLEEAGGPACLYVDPDNVKEMADALSQALYDTNFREHCIRESKAYVQRFDNNNVTQRIIDLYHSLL